MICYDFFNPKIASKWKVLKYLDVYPDRGVKKFTLQEVEVSDYDCLIIELKMLYTIITRAKCTLIMMGGLPE